MSRSTPLPNGFIHDAHRAHHIIVLEMMDDDERFHVCNVSGAWHCNKGWDSLHHCIYAFDQVLVQLHQFSELHSDIM
jgi:hypothetical protein